jgi:hypothetical protein
MQNIPIFNILFNNSTYVLSELAIHEAANNLLGMQSLESDKLI